MKKYSSYIYLLLFFNVLVILSSCKKETPLEQTFKVDIPSGTPEVAYVGRELTFDVALNAASGLQKAEVRMDFQQVEGSEQSDYANSTTGIYHFSYTPTEFDLGKRLSFVIVAYDSRGFTTSATHEVMVEEAPVNIEIQIPEDAPSTTSPEELIEFDIQVSSELDIKEISTSVNGAIIEDLTKTNFDNPRLDFYHLAYTTNNDDAGTELVFTIQVTDVENKVKTAEYKIVVDGNRVPKPVVEFRDVMLGGQKSTENGHFLNTTTGSTHFSDGVAAISETIDLLFFVSGSSTGKNITAPSFSNSAIVYSVNQSDEVNALAAWPVRNDTKLKRLTGVSPEDFEAIVLDSEIKALYDSVEEATDNINRITENDIIVFKTVKDKYGIIIVKAPLPAKNTGSLIFDYKIQK